MKYISTRDKSQTYSFSDAALKGLAPDGGLFVPEAIPSVAANLLGGQRDLAEIATRVLEPFFAEDELLPLLPEICTEAFDFPLVLKDLNHNTSVLQLFHGPTAAFKDFGARFLAACFSRLQHIGSRTVLVATSGDTGGAVAAAFYKKQGISVKILFPKEGISALQFQQLTCWGKNIESFAVEGSFDDCQRIVKEAFRDPSLSRRLSLTSANSINIGRLLPQVVYYAAAATWVQKRHGIAPSLIVPSGNLGNAQGAIWAKKMGFPIDHIAIATNANRAIAEYFASGFFKGYDTIKTLANAMDVGNPSNMERILNLFITLDDFKNYCSVLSVTDAEIRDEIARGKSDWGEIWCPHTATAARFRRAIGLDDPRHWIIVATAHPAKFASIVEPLVGHPIAVPAALADLMTRESRFKVIAPTLEAFTAALK